MNIQDELGIEGALLVLYGKTQREIAADSTLRNQAEKLLALHKKLVWQEIYPPTDLCLIETRYTIALAKAIGALEIAGSIHS